MPLERQQVPAIRNPGLVPDFSGRIVNAEALAFQTAWVFIHLVQDTIVESKVHSGVRRGCFFVAHVVDVPVSNPEVELPVLRCVAGRGHRAGGKSKHRDESDDRGPAHVGAIVGRSRGSRLSRSFGRIVLIEIP
jgi:hypothetical protein